MLKQNVEQVNIFGTYASPLISKKGIYFHQWSVEQNDDKLEIRGPITIKLEIF